MILNHIDRIHQWKRFGKTNPISVEFSITEKCNLRCPYCPSEFRDIELPFKLFRKILISLKRLRIKSIILSGYGEPLLHKDIVKIINVSKHFNFNIGIVTNGVLINQLTSDVITKQCDWIRLSVDASTPEEYASVHQYDPLAFDKILNNIKMLHEYKAKNDSKILIQASYLTGLCKEKGPGDFYIEFKDKVDQINIHPMINISQVAYSHVIDILKKMPRVYVHPNYNIIENCPSVDCHIPGNFFGFIEADANVRGCPYRKDEIWGNIKDVTLEYLWRNLNYSSSRCTTYCKFWHDNIVLSNILNSQYSFLE